MKYLLYVISIILLTNCSEPKTEESTEVAFEEPKEIAIEVEPAANETVTDDQLRAAGEMYCTCLSDEQKQLLESSVTMYPDKDIDPCKRMQNLIDGFTILRLTNNCFITEEMKLAITNTLGYPNVEAYYTEVDEQRRGQHTMRYLELGCSSLYNFMNYFYSSNGVPEIADEELAEAGCEHLANELVELFKR